MSYFSHIYSALPNELPHRARSVYMYLWDCMGRKSDCWPAIKTIASDLQLSPSTVKRAINDLVRAGFIEKEPK